MIASSQLYLRNPTTHTKGNALLNGSMTYLDEIRSSVICQDANNNTTCLEGWVKLDTVFQPSNWANLVSSLAAMIGCVLMFAAYGCFHDYRTGTRRVATSLALANFFLALGSLVGAVNVLVFSYLSPSLTSEDTPCTAFGLICQAQAFLTWTSAIASFVWTIILSGTLYVALVKGKISFLSLPSTWLLFFLSSLVVPLVIFVPILGTNHLGYSPFYSGAGCFIATSYQYTLTSTSLVSVVKGLEVISYCVVIVFFALISFDFKQPTRFGKVSCVGCGTECSVSSFEVCNHVRVETGDYRKPENFFLRKFPSQKICVTIFVRRTNIENSTTRIFQCLNVPKYFCRFHFFGTEPSSRKF